MSEVLCERIVGNLEALGRELIELRRQARRREDDIAAIRGNLAEAVERGNGGSGIGRRPTRRRDGIGLDIISAIGQVIGSDNSAEIDRLEQQIADAESDLARLEHEIADKERLIADEQSDFVRYNCYDLGHSHEVLNLHGVREGATLSA